MAIRKGLPAKLALTDADDTRYALSNLVVCDSAGVPRSGVTSPVNTNIVTSSATMNVSVARFQGVAVRDAGVVLLSNDGPTNVLVGTAPASNSRLDVIYAKQNDASSTVTVPDANNTPVFGVLAGVASATPVRNPAGLPAGALELATILVPSTATATNSAGVVITQTAQFTAAAGGVVPFRTTAERDAFSAAGGARGYVIANKAEYTRDGVIWAPSGVAMAGGKVIRSAVAASLGAGAWAVLNNSTHWVSDVPALDVAAFSGIWTCTVPGIYDVEAGIQLDTTTSLLFILKKNDVSAGAVGEVAGTSVTGQVGFTVASLRTRVSLAAGDTLALAALPSVASVWSTAIPRGTFFGLRYVEPLR